MRTKHFKGPWRLQILGSCEADLSCGGTFMGLNGGSGAPETFDPEYVEEWEATAHVVAAAPELLECLKDARRLLTDQDAIDLAHIDEVIAKATK